MAYNAVLTIAFIFTVFIIGKLLERNHDKIVKQNRLGLLVMLRIIKIFIYFLVLVPIFFLWQPEVYSLFNILDSTHPMMTQLIMIIVVWASAIYIVRNISGVILELQQDVRVKSVDKEVGTLLRKMVKYLTYAGALVWTLGVFRITGAIEGLLVGAGFAGIVIGFAAQQTLSNLLAGISLLLDRPFKIGQWIHLKDSDLVGEVKEISLRSTTINAPDNTLISIPNSKVANEPIVNYSSHKLRRFFLDVSISYESDLQKAVKIIKDTLDKDPATVAEGIPGQGYFAPTEIVVEGFGDSSVNLKAKVFVDVDVAGGQFLTKSRMLENIKKNLTKAGIEIPYPRQYVIFDKDQKKKRKKS